MSRDTEKRQHVHSLVPIDDEPVTDEEAQAICRSEAWFASGGKGIPMEEVLADVGLSLNDFPLRRKL
jgi:hypothetical protein